MATKTIAYTEKMVGAGHPVLSDTLNRLTLVGHNTDGSHKGYVEASQEGNLAATLAAVPTTTQIVITDSQTLVGGTVITHPIHIAPGGSITSASGILTFNGQFTAGMQRVFYGSGTQVFGTGAVTEVYPEWWGIDGVDDDVEINKAISAIPAVGGSVKLQPKTYNINASIIIGNGSESGASTRNNVFLLGSGMGSSEEIIVGNDTGTMLYWSNISAGTMLDLWGPIVGVKICDLCFDCNGVATSGMDLKNPAFSEFKNIVVKGHIATAPNYDQFAVSVIGYQDTTATYSRGAISNVFDKLIIRNPSADSNGITIGNGTRNTGAAWDVLQSEFRDCTFTSNSSNVSHNCTSVELRFADNISFYQCIFAQFTDANGSALRIKPPTGTATNNYVFPAEISVYSTAVIGGIDVQGTWVPSGNAGINFNPWPIADGETTPAIPYIFGITSHGRRFGVGYSGCILNDHGNTNIAITSGAATTVSFPYVNSDYETMLYDMGGGVYGIKPGYTGLYQLGVHIQWGASTLGDRNIIVYKRDVSASTDIELSRVTQRATASGGVIQSVVVADELTDIADYYFVKVYQDTGSNLDLVRTNATDVRAPKFWCTRVR